MRSYGQTLPGGPLNGSHLPIPVDPTLRRRVAPKPKPTRVVPAGPVAHDATYGVGRGGPVTDSERSAIRAAWADGQTAITIALRFGRARQTVYEVVKGAVR
jgi:hypothetical protein